MLKKFLFKTKSTLEKKQSILLLGIGGQHPIMDAC